jgi:RNA polymerase sigma-70 factor (ECF subfamily)
MGLPAAGNNGRSQATEVLYREHGPAVAALCRSLLRDRSEAEDATQQVFLSAHRALLNGTVPGEPLMWLLAVARHECYTRFRQRAGSPVPSDEVPQGATPDSSAHAQRAGELATVWDEVGRMPTAQREAFLMREIRGFSYAEVADELSLSQPSVRSLLLRARTRLRHRLRNVAASLGAAPWPLVRIVTGGDGASPVTAATKAALVGLGAVVLVGGGGLARNSHNALRTSRDGGSRQRTRVHTSRAATPTTAAVAAPADRFGLAASDSKPLRVSGHDGRDEGSPGADGRSAGDASEPQSGQHQADGGDTSTGVSSNDSADSGSAGGSAAASSGSDDGSDSTTTPISSGSDGGSSGGPDG